MDDVLVHKRSIQDLTEKLDNFLEENLKLKPSKLKICEQEEFGGALISSKLVQQEQKVCILQKDRRNVKLEVGSL